VYDAKQDMLIKHYITNMDNEFRPKKMLMNGNAVPTDGRLWTTVNRRWSCMNRQATLTGRPVP